MEEGCSLLAGTCIIAPRGEIAAQTMTKGDELITHVCDLELARRNKRAMFEFAKHRRPEHYGLITEIAGPVD